MATKTETTAARLRELEAENARLREIEAENTRLRAELRRPGAPRHRGRAVLATALIVIGAILAPIGVVTSWAAAQASDTELFVATLAPLAEDPAVQKAIVDAAADAIDEALDPEALTAALVDSLVDAESTPRLAAAADLLAPLLADQARSAIRTGLATVVESPAFAEAWEQAIRVAHSSTVAALSGETGALTISDDGTIALEVGELITSLKPALIDAGFGFVDLIPSIDATIEIAQFPELGLARSVYATLTTVGPVLPWIALALVVLGVALAPRRPRALVVAGVLLIVVGGAVAGTLAALGTLAAAQLAGTVSAAATSAVYAALTSTLSSVMLAIAMLGAVALVAGLLSGASTPAVRLRALGSDLAGRSSGFLVERGLLPAGAPAGLRRAGWVVTLALAVIAVILLVVLRPLTPGDILLGALVLGVIALVYALLRGAAPDAEVAAPADVAEPAA